MNKKLLISLVSLSVATITPILFFTSCSQEPTTKNDLKITANEAQNLTEPEVLDLRGTDFDKKIIVLKKMFTGIDLENQNKFNVSIDENNVVTLTAIEGYKISGELSLSAPAYSINLAITVKAGPITLTGMDIIDISGQHIPKKIVALSKLFDGVDFINQLHFSTKIETGNIVTLTANKGFDFNNKESISSNTYKETVSALDITLKPAAKLFSTEDTIINDKLDNDFSFAQLDVLEKLFSGVSISNYEYFTFEIINKVVTLKAKPGIVFGADAASGKNTLVAPAYSIYINLDISIIKNNISLSITDLADLQGTNADKKLVVLQKLFEGPGLTLANQSHFSITIDNKNKLITLLANDGYAFGFEFMLQTVYTTAKKVLKITPKANPTITRQDVAILKLTQSVDNVVAQVASLSKLFNGITKDNINFFFITMDETNKVCKLLMIPNSDYVFEINNSNRLTSNTYTLG
ncbi:MAG: hypothetical protein ACRCRP_00465 [Metamycoplasmataceae bacterium]